MPETRVEQNIRVTQFAASDIFKTGTDLLRTGLEQTVELQKHMLDIACQQNSDIAMMWRRMFQSAPAAESMVKLAEQTVATLFEGQKAFLGLIAQQFAQVAETTKTEADRTAAAAERVNDFETAAGAN